MIGSGMRVEQTVTWQYLARYITFLIQTGLGGLSVMFMTTGCQPNNNSPSSSESTNHRPPVMPPSIVKLSMPAKSSTTQTASTASATGEPTPSVTLNVAASSSLNGALPAMIDDFTHQYPHIHFQVTYDSSDKLYQRIREHNGYDILLSSNQVHTQRLYKDDRIRADNPSSDTQPFIYAQGQLVLYSTKYQLTNTPTQLLDDLILQAHPITLAMTEPDASPYGEAAQAWLINQNLADQTQIQLRPYTSLKDTFAATDSGQTDFGFVSLAQVLTRVRDHNVREATKINSYALLAKSDYPVILQEGIIIKPSDASRQFVAYLRSPKGQMLLNEAGYLPVCDDNGLKLPACN